MICYCLYYNENIEFPVHKYICRQIVFIYIICMKRAENNLG